LNIISEILLSIGHTLLDVSPYLLIGFVAAGLVKGFVKEESIFRRLGSPTIGSVVKASLYGTPLPLCSCSVIPMAASLRQSGASKGATVSFLISTPESGADSVAISYAMLDPLMTIFRPVAAFCSAVVAGMAENMINRQAISTINVQQTDACGCAQEFSSRPDGFLDRVKYGMHYAFTDLLGDIAYYLAIGLIVSGLIAALIPEDFFAGYLNNEIISMTAMLLLGIPMYVCASASTPIAAALILKGISPGAALVFLLVGPATNFATIGVVKSLLGTKSLWIYLGSISLVAVLMGLLLNWIYFLFQIPIHIQFASTSESFSNVVRWVSVILLIPLLVWGLYREIRHRFS